MTDKPGPAAKRGPRAEGDGNLSEFFVRLERRDSSPELEAGGRRGRFRCRSRRRTLPRTQRPGVGTDVEPGWTAPVICRPGISFAMAPWTDRHPLASAGAGRGRDGGAARRCRGLLMRGIPSSHDDGPLCAMRLPQSQLSTATTRCCNLILRLQRPGCRRRGKEADRRLIFTGGGMGDCRRTRSTAGSGSRDAGRLPVAFLLAVYPAPARKIRRA